MARDSRRQPSPSIHRQRTLRVLGTDISLLEAVRFKAISDLGFNIEFEVLDFLRQRRAFSELPSVQVKRFIFA